MRGKAKCLYHITGKNSQSTKPSKNTGIYRGINNIFLIALVTCKSRTLSVIECLISPEDVFMCHDAELQNRPKNAL